MYFHPDSRTFKRKPPAGGAERTFVAFILEPLYKIYSQVCCARSTLPPVDPQKERSSM